MQKSKYYTFIERYDFESGAKLEDWEYNKNKKYLIKIYEHVEFKKQYNNIVKYITYGYKHSGQTRIEF